MTGDHAAAGFAEHASSLGSWERAWRRAAGPMAGHLDAYHGYRQRLASPVAHRGVPRPTLPLVLGFGPPQAVTAAHAPARVVTATSFVAGLHDREVTVEAEAYHGVQVELSPPTARRLLGVPLAELTGQTVPLEDVLGRSAARLVDDLAGEPGWARRFARLDGALGGLLAATPPPAGELQHAWRRLVASGGRVAVGRLAAEVGWSPRHLSRRFTHELGLSPKRMARLIRFDRAAARIQQGEDLATVALETGFADQAHLSREVRAHCGLTPGRLRALALPDAGGVFDLDS